MSLSGVYDVGGTRVENRLRLINETYADYSSGGFGTGTSYAFREDKNMGIDGLINTRISWDKLVEEGKVTVNQNTLESCDTSLEGFLRIPESITQISAGAFRNCSKLSGLEIPDSIQTLRSSAFYNFTGLKDIIIGSGVTSIGSAAFEGCSNLEKIVIPDNVKSMSPQAFTNCINLKNVMIGKGVTTFVSGMFFHQTSLKNIMVDTGTNQIQGAAFDGCTNLSNVYYRGTQAQWNSINIVSGGNTSLLNATKYYNQ